MTTITEEMVEDALKAVWWQNNYENRQRMRAALTAALSKLPPAPDREMLIVARRFLEIFVDEYEGEHGVPTREGHFFNRAREFLKTSRVASPPDRNAVIEEWWNVDNQDWDYLLSLIPDGGRGRFWKDVFKRHRRALKTNPGNAATAP